MDIDGRKILTLDCGNTSLKGVLWDGERMRLSFRLVVGEAPGAALREQLKGVELVAGVTVHGKEGLEASELLPELGAGLWVGRELPVPGRVLYDRPREMGRDRRVTCRGALELHGPCLVVDCGTAVTLTHIDAEAHIRGLAISAGYGCLRRALADVAPALRPFLDGVENDSLPRGTAENLALGLEGGWRGLLRELIREAERRLEIERPAGGLGELVFTASDGWRAHVAVGRGVHSPALVHRGLHGLLSEHS